MTAKDPTAVFNELMARIDHPMVVVTTAAGHARAGCLVGFHCQCGMGRVGPSSAGAVHSDQNTGGIRQTTAATSTYSERRRANAPCLT